MNSGQVVSPSAIFPNAGISKQSHKDTTKSWSTLNLTSSNSVFRGTALTYIEYYKHQLSPFDYLTWCSQLLFWCEAVFGWWRLDHYLILTTTETGTTLLCRFLHFLSPDFVLRKIYFLIVTSMYKKAFCLGWGRRMLCRKIDVFYLKQAVLERCDIVYIEPTRYASLLIPK